MVSFNGTYYFINNLATSSVGSGGAIAADANSTLTFNGTIYFSNNGGRRDAMNGGGVFMEIELTQLCSGRTIMQIYIGGAIYVQAASPKSYCNLYIPKEECFSQLPDQKLTNDIDVQPFFSNNSADAAGSLLYGGAHSSGEIFDMIFHNSDTDYQTISNVSSDPLGVCRCINKQPVCSEFIQLEVYPGETFHVSVIALEQRVPSTVRSVIVLGQVDLQAFQYLQEANNTCSKLNYTVFSLSQHVGIQLHV